MALNHIVSFCIISAPSFVFRAKTAAQIGKLCNFLVGWPLCVVVYVVRP